MDEALPFKKNIATSEFPQFIMCVLLMPADDKLSPEQKATGFFFALVAQH